MITKEEIAEIVGPVIWAHSGTCTCDFSSEAVTTEACSKILESAMNAREARAELFMKVLQRETSEAIKYAIDQVFKKLAEAGKGERESE